MNKVRKYLAKMDRAVDYDFYDDDDLRYVRFKSPFNCRPLIGRRPPLGYAVLLRAPACWFVRTLAEINFGELFGNFDGFAPWCLRCLRAGRTWGSAPSASSGAAARTTYGNGAPLDLVDSVCVETNEGRVIRALLLTLPSVLVGDCCSEEAAFGDFGDNADWEDEV